MDPSLLRDTLITDAAIIGGLLVVSTWLRARLRPFQWLLLPAPVIAGFLGLILGPHALNVLPFSPAIGSYTTLLIAAVFASMALVQDFTLSRLNAEVRAFTGYGIAMSAGQVLLGVVLTMVVLGPALGAPHFMGLILFAAWSGGFGTSAAIGDVFASAGHPEVTSVAFSAATVGMLTGIVGGVILARVGQSRGHARIASTTEALPRSTRTGLLADDERTPLGSHTLSGSSMETLAFHGALLAVIVGVGSILQKLSAEWLNDFALPLFATAFLVGLAARALLTRTQAHRVIDPGTMKSLSGSASDILIVCGIASIEPSFVAQHLPALIAIFIAGLVFCLLLGFVVAPRFLGKDWFEKQIFTWGWATGSVATGIALLRIVDPHHESDTVEEFGYAYLPLIPIEGAAVAIAPLLVIAQASWAVALAWGLIAAAGLWMMAAGARSARRAGHP